MALKLFELALFYYLIRRLCTSFNDTADHQIDRPIIMRLKTSIFFLCFMFTLNCIGQSFHITINNTTPYSLSLVTKVAYGKKQGVFSLKEKSTTTITLDPDQALQGVEGNIQINNARLEGVLDIYYNNPFIGASSYSLTHYPNYLLYNLKWDLEQNSLYMDIVQSKNTLNKVALDYTTDGTITGFISWKRQQIKEPIGSLSSAFLVKVIAPRVFVQETDGSGNAISIPLNGAFSGVWNGQQGYFEGRQEIGQVSFKELSSDGQQVNLQYTIKGVPTGIPLFLDLERNPQTNWIAGPENPKPDDKSIFVVGTFPLDNNATVITLNKPQNTSGNIQYVCIGSWVKPGSNGTASGNADVTFQQKILNRRNSIILPAINIPNNSLKTKKSF